MRKAKSSCRYANLQSIIRLCLSAIQRQPDVAWQIRAMADRRELTGRSAAAHALWRVLCVNAKARFWMTPGMSP